MTLADALKESLMKHKAQPGMPAVRGELLWPEQAADRIGVKISTFKRMLANARSAQADGKTRPSHLPLPLFYEQRTAPRGHGLHAVVVTSGRWDSAVLDDWMAQRPGTPAARKAARDAG